MAPSAAGNVAIALTREAVPSGFPIPREWREAMAAEDANPRLLQSTIVNAFLNGVRRERDVEGRWKMPMRFLREGGDCEDFAIAKYVALRRLGFAADELRIVIARVRGRPGVLYAVVVDGGPEPYRTYLLDSTSDYVRSTLYADEYVPVLSFNENGIWTHSNDAVAVLRRLREFRPDNAASCCNA